MVKKNTFKEPILFSELKKLKNFDNILWNDNTNLKENIFNIKEFIDYIKVNCKISNFNMDLDIYYSYKIIAISDINRHIENVRLIKSKEYLYLIIDPEAKYLYLSTGKSHPIFWYKFLSKKSFVKQFDEIYDFYNPKKYNYELMGNITGHIGNQDMLGLSIYDIENHFLKNNFCEKLIWGSLWEDHPFRDEYLKNNLTYQENIILTGQAMRQDIDTYTVSVRTLFSKSLIKIILSENELFVNIKYDPFNSPQISYINKKLKKNYSNDIPIDVVMVLINLPYMLFNDIIQKKPFNEYALYILSILIDNSEETDFGNIILKLNSLTQKNDIDHEMKENIKTLIKNINLNLNLNKIFEDINIENLYNQILDKIDNNEDNEYANNEDNKDIENTISEEVDKILESYDGNKYNIEKDLLKNIMVEILKEKFDFL